MWLYKCPICKQNIDFDYDENTIPDEDEMLEFFNEKYNEITIEGEMWCPKCSKRYSFKEHWVNTLKNFTVTEIPF